MTVGELHAEAIVANQVHVFDREIKWHGSWVEQALAGELRLAMSARAAQPQVAGRPHIFVAFVVPDQTNFRFAETDDFNWHWHGGVIARSFADDKGCELSGVMREVVSAVSTLARLRLAQVLLAISAVPPGLVSARLWRHCCRSRDATI